MTWEWLRHRATAQALHDLDAPSPWRRRLWALEATDRAIVLGSTQADVVDRSAAAEVGVSVARRRSGGGAVLVGPDEVVWVDVFVPRADPLWVDDVAVASHWLGRAWADALSAVGVRDTRVHEAAMRHHVDSRLVCFAGAGPGEVFIGDAKVVGIAQRRTREGARFQCAVPLRWEPSTWTDLLRPGPVEDLANVARGVDVDPRLLVTALRGVLPD